MNVLRSIIRGNNGSRILKNIPLFLAIFATLFFGLTSRGQTTDIYSTPGTYDWVVPACVTSVTVRAWGAGGAGAGATSTDRNGGGGGGGAYCIKTETVTPGETLRIIVGAGGAAGNSNGGNGGFSQVMHLTGSVIFCKAAGGAGGLRASCSTCSGTGGAGGSISNNIPVNTGFSGGNGGASDPSTTSYDQSGGGGGGAGSGSNGGNGGTPSAGMAGSPGGGVGGAGILTTSTGGSNGNPGVILGGGGGGATTYTGNTSGGAGARGQVTITYTTTGCEPAGSVFAYSTPGTYSWVVPACVNYVTVEAWGGGGGGGGNIAILKTSGSGTETCTGAGGGGGGGYSTRTFAVSPGQTYTIVVGAGGTGGAAGAGTTASGISTPAGTGGVGQTSSFSGNSYNLQATGGNGGGGAGGYSTVVGNCVLANGAGGTGGTGIGGSINYTGGSGAAGLILDHSTDKSGGGGGAAGPGGNGGNATPAGSIGVASPPGGIGNPPGGNGGIGRLWNTPALSQQNGASGVTIGGGGGGSLIHTSSIGVFTAIGGTGAPGEVRLTYNTGCPLPIELLYFSGSCNETVKTFNWSTATEHDNQFFTIEHSQTGTEYYPVEVINGAVNSTVQLNYSRSIKEEDESFKYYRLKQTDTDGAFTYSDVIHVDCHENEPLLVNPNPFDDQLTIDFEQIKEENIEIVVLDVNGRVVYRGIKEKFMKMQQMTLDVSYLSRGVYYLEIRSVVNNTLLSKAKITKL